MSLMVSRTTFFTIKNKKPRLNVIGIDNLSASCVFKAFTFPKPFEKEVGWIFDTGEKFLQYRTSLCAQQKKTVLTLKFCANLCEFAVKRPNPQKKRKIPICCWQQNRKKICCQIFSKKKEKKPVLTANRTSFFASDSKLKQFSHVAYVKRRARETSFFSPKRLFKSHLCLFINSIVKNVIKFEL